MLGALTLHRYLIDFRRWEQCFCSLEAMLLQPESNALAVRNQCSGTLERLQPPCRSNAIFFKMAKM
jgi:hypothetical protein